MPRRQKDNRRSSHNLPYQPARNPGDREKQLIGLAINLSEKQLYDGTASPSVITHFLKLATVREQKEREILDRQAKLLEAKTEALDTNKNIEQLYNNAIEAMSSYGPSKDG